MSWSLQTVTPIFKFISMKIASTTNILKLLILYLLSFYHLRYDLDILIKLKTLICSLNIRYFNIGKHKSINFVAAQGTFAKPNEGSAWTWEMLITITGEAFLLISIISRISPTGHPCGAAHLLVALYPWS